MCNMKSALITGISGQDGSYLAEHLLGLGYNVCGLVRREPGAMRWLQPIERRIELVYGDLRDPMSLAVAFQKAWPDEVYNLAAQSFVPTSWTQPVLTGDVTGLGVLRMLEALHKHCPKARFLQASSSEMFGKVHESPQTEKTRFYPRSPYGAAKVFGHQITINYRESYGMFACATICFNHESPRRGLEFVTRKVTYQVARIKCGLAQRLRMGNMDAKRDWGYAGDYVQAMWLMLQRTEPKDYVIATGETHSVQELVELAFSAAGLDWHEYVEIDPKLIRPAEVDYLRGDATLAREELGWQSQVGFQELIRMMVQADLQTARNLAPAPVPTGA